MKRFLNAVLTWLLGPREPEPGYRARKWRQKQAREEMNRALRTGEFRR